VDLNGSWKRFGSREILSDEAQMHGKAQRIEMPRQLRNDALSPTPAEMRDQEQ
jgi:hypothetical protein